MEIDGWMNACFDVKIHVFHSFIILKRLIETVYMYPVTKWGGNIVCWIKKST